MKLIYKFLLIFSLFSIGLGIIICFAISKNYERTIKKRYYEHAKCVALLAATYVDGDKIRQYIETLEPDEEYKVMQETLDNIKEKMDVFYLSIICPVSEEEGLYIYDAKLTKAQEEACGLPAATLGEYEPFIDSEGRDNYVAAKETFRTGVMNDVLYESVTQQGQQLQALGSVFIPIRDSGDEIVAYLGVDVLIDDVKISIDEAVLSLVKLIILVTVIFFILLIVIVEISVIFPVRELGKYAEKISDGIFGEQMRVRGHDELSEIAKVFNRMSISINGHMKEIQIINDEYHKYVPSEIFQLLKKKNVIDVKLGDQVMTDLSVLSFSIINFKELTRKMDSEEMFAFINRFLRPITPIAGKSGGFIHLFENSGFLVFQKDGGRKILDSSIEMSQKFLQIMEQEEPEIRNRLKFGIAIDYGEVMLGIVGAKERVAAVSVSEPNNICDFLSNIADKYNSHILMTATAAGQISDFEEKYSSRCIGYLYISSLDRAEKLYDVYDGDSDEDRRLKEQTKELFQSGVDYYCTGEFERARACFIEILKVFKRDSASREYLYRCNQYYTLENGMKPDIYIESY